MVIGAVDDVHSSRKPRCVRAGRAQAAVDEPRSLSVAADSSRRRRGRSVSRRTVS